MAYANGRIPRRALRRIPGGWLMPLPARAWNAMCARARRLGKKVPMPNGPASSYRNFAQQVAMKAMWTARGRPGNAATPGTSNHGRGTTVDTNDGDEIDEIGHPFGWGYKSDAPWEAWHHLWDSATRWRPKPDPLEPDERRAVNELQRLRRRRIKSRKVRKRITYLSEWLLRRANVLTARAKAAHSWKKHRRGVRRAVIVGVLGDAAIARMRKRARLRRRKK